MSDKYPQSELDYSSMISTDFAPTHSWKPRMRPKQMLEHYAERERKARRIRFRRWLTDFATHPATFIFVVFALGIGVLFLPLSEEARQGMLIGAAVGLVAFARGFR